MIRKTSIVPLTQRRERRARRSSDALTALNYLLQSSRDRGGMDLLVLANEDGLPLVTVGTDFRCEELCAYAPFFAGRRPRLRGRALPEPSAIRPVRVGSSEVYLCAMGGVRPLLEGEMERAAQAVARIL